MIINSISIKKFRGFKDVQFKLGQNLTVIAGQNGTQKTTLLGVLSQPFTITDKNNPMREEKPLTGGVFRSAFAEKFKLSPKFDVPKSHEWTLNLNREEDPEFTLESSLRSGTQNIRFWQKGERGKGSGYIQCPVIYLSLSRLFPIGEDTKLNSSTALDLNKEEMDFYRTWHNEILILTRLNITAVDYLVSKQKHTIGVNTAHYDWKMNSAGQDNIGKILLAILSFKRLKEKYPNNYAGGILVIDELDATLYPASQIKLVDALASFSAKYNIQIIFTTHSLTILEYTCKLQNNLKRPGQAQVIYLQQKDLNVKVIPNISFEEIKNHLNVVMNEDISVKKIRLFTEDKEGEIFLKALLKRSSANFDFQDCSLGCKNLQQLVEKKICGFGFLESIIVLDGDENIKKDFKNILTLPGGNSPEKVIAKFLSSLSDESFIWNQIKHGYSHQIAFRDHKPDKIFHNSNETKAREIAKAWFKSQQKYWGRNCARVINPWIKQNQEEVNTFLNNLESLSKQYIKEQ